MGGRWNNTGASSSFLLGLLLASVPAVLCWILIGMNLPAPSPAAKSEPAPSSEETKTDEAPAARLEQFAVASGPTAGPAPVGMRRAFAPKRRVKKGLTLYSVTSQATPPAPARHRPLDRCSATSSPWPCPAALVEQLEKVNAPDAEQWADMAIEQLKSLRSAPSLGGNKAAKSIARLGAIHADGQPLAQANPELAAAHYSLTRRLALWRAVHEYAKRGGELRPLAMSDLNAVADMLGRVEKSLEGSEHQSDWMSFFELGKLKATGLSGVELRQTAGRILNRLDQTSLSEPQKDWLARPPFDDFVHSLRSWSEPIDCAQFLAQLEQFETTSNHELARELARQRRLFAKSPDGVLRGLAGEVQAHYCNANVCLTVSEEMVNRRLPQAAPREEGFEQCLISGPLFGSTSIHTRLKARLSPHPRSLRVMVEATGEVRAETAAPRPLATYYNQGASQYRARAVAEVGLRSIKVAPAHVEAETCAELVGLETRFDNLPLLGALAQSMALSRYRSHAPHALWEAERHIVSDAQQRLAATVKGRLDAIADKVRREALAPLCVAGQRPQIVGLKTTSSHLVARVRVGSEDALAAHTLPPAAPRGSLVSVQVHESTFNNLAADLRLAGQQVSMEKLHRILARRAPWLAAPLCGSPSDEILVTFAEANPLRVKLDHGAATVTMALAELSHRERVWHDVIVHRRLRPQSTARLAGFRMDDRIEIQGDRLTPEDRASLASLLDESVVGNDIFASFSSAISSMPMTDELKLTGVVLKDGWLAIALGSASGEDRLADENGSELR